MTSLIFSFWTDEQNRHQTIRMDAAVLQTDTSSWWTDVKTIQTDVETIWTGVRTVQTDVVILQMDANDFRTDTQNVWMVCRMLWTVFLGIRMDDKQITNSFPIQTDNR